MIFESTPVEKAIGKVLAHTVVSGDFVLSKGRIINQEDARQLRSVGVVNINSIELEKGEILEKEAALKVADTVLGKGVYLDVKSSGSVDVRAEYDGVFTVNEELVNNCNRTCGAMTIATLNGLSVVKKGDRVAAIKTIPYAAKSKDIETICTYLKNFNDVIAVSMFKSLKVGLIQSENNTTRDELHGKAENVIRKRLSHLSAEIESVIKCEHSLEGMKGAIQKLQKECCDLIVIVGPNAIVDENDLIPSAIKGLGGKIEHYGMPVEPGHMLLLGYLSIPIIGSPTCVRSPKNNGFDHILKLLSIGRKVTRVDIMGMGVGGLLR